MKKPELPVDRSRSPIDLRPGFDSFCDFGLKNNILYCIKMDSKNLPIAACGLYCGTCRRFERGKCPGCAANSAATWCSVRTCCGENGWQSCADCTRMPLEKCGKFNNFIGKVFGVIFRSDRSGCIRRIREVGAAAFAEEMQRSGSYNRPVKKATDRSE